MNEIVLISRLAGEIPPMSADAFESGRRRLLTRHRWVTARRIMRVLWVVALAALPIGLAVTGACFVDLQVYRTGGFAWLQGIPLYAGFPGALDGPRLPFTYPPIAGFLSLSVVCLLVTRRLTRRADVVWTIAPAAAVAAVVLEPVLSTLLFGQINLVLMALVVVDCLAVRDPRWRGVLVGVAASIKLTPAITSAVTFAGLALTGFVPAPRDSTEYWCHALLDPGRAGGLAYLANQSLRGVPHRFDPGRSAETLLWIALSTIMVLLAVVAAHRARNDVVALSAIATAGLLVSPVSWSHHWVWCVPAFLALGFVRRGGTRVVLGALLVVFLVHPFTWPPGNDDREMSWSWWQHVYGDAYTWIAIGVLVTLVVAGTRTSPPCPVLSSA